MTSRAPSPTPSTIPTFSGACARGQRPAARLLVLALLGVVLTARDAHAYLDPASGSMILQLAVGGAMGALYFAKKRWHTVRGWFGRRGTDGAKAEDAPPRSSSGAR